MIINERKIEFDRLPVGINNAYSTNRQGRRFLTNEAKAWKEEVALAFRGYKISKKDFGVEIYLTFGDKRKRDIDSGLKFLLDSLSGTVWSDDRQVREIFIYRDFGKKHKTIIEVYEIE